MSNINEVRERLERLAANAEEYGLRVLAKPEHIRALLDDHARLQADADRWRYARTILTIEAIEDAHLNALKAHSAGISASEDENIRADQAIDAAKAVQS